jgi:predicted DNA-binding protein with PD1-like motif
MAAPEAKPVNVHFLRLKPDELVVESLQTWARKNSIEAASILSAVGSLKKATLRFANQPRGESLEGPFEIVSLSGTLSKDSMHLHASISDSKGTTRGGHLTGENRIHTTLELVIGVYPSVKFAREKDPVTGYAELLVKPGMP